MEDKPETETAPNETLIEDGKNAKSVTCEGCSSKILKRQTASFILTEKFLPHMKVSSDASSENGESIRHFWSVEDMFTFENVAFSNTVGTTKYLVCADCESGPIGWHDMETKKSYVALSRVKHC